MGVVLRRYIDILIVIINFPYSTCISSFFAAAASLFLCSFFNVSSFLFMLFLCNKLTLFKKHSRWFKNLDHADMAILLYRLDVMSEILHIYNTLQMRKYLALGTLSCILNTTISFYS